MPSCRLFTVKGRVQGVFFRDSTKRAADSLGLTGHAVNLDNGDVEVLACGPEADIERLAEWLREGPPMASVTGLHSETIDVRPPEDFRTG